MKEFDDNLCRGCKRPELHKMCPAYGTKFYLSDEPFTVELELKAEEYANFNGLDKKIVADMLFDEIQRNKPATWNELVNEYQYEQLKSIRGENKSHTKSIVILFIAILCGIAFCVLL